LANVKLGSVYLAGIIIVAHLQGKISYGNFSSSEASNGLAPVQISGYLGFGSSMLFIGLMNPAEKGARIINAIVFILVAVVMVLTFSRGGLYFLSAIVFMYLFFNRGSLGNYFKYLLLIPVAFWGFNFVVDQTGGAILKRYEEKGSSNRDVLVVAAFQLFLENPVFGVGTSNFGTAVVRYGFFREESTAHNEFARSMAEHGVFGIFTYWGFYILLLIGLIRRKEPERQYSLYFYALFFFIVIHNGLKISIQPLLMILAIANPTIFVARKKISNAIQQPRALHQPV
jgi:O-antigen ligase